ncbi:MAG TPA: ATP-binding protein [Candidatus Binatia bacterium]|nr:ATP-binding protein [Candidatus Binatia bacterium]
MSAQIGQVSEVTGSNIKASMDAAQLASAQSAGESASVTVGSMVEVRSGGARVLGIVSAIRSAGQDKGAIMDISLVGQFVAGASGGSEFKRGVARWPAIGAPVMTVADADAASVVRTTSTSTVHIGKAEFNGTQDIYLDVDNLLRTHFAIFGSSGSGKTSTTSVILRAILERLPNAHMVLLDPHNEYEGAFAGMTERLTLSTLRLPYWMLQFKEMCAVFKVLPESEYASEVKILREAVVQAKTLYAGIAGAGTAKPGQPAGVTTTSSLNLDSPVPFRLSDFRRIVNDMMGKLDNPEAIQSYLRILNRLEELTSDDRYGFMFGPQFVRDVMGEVICQMARIPVEGKPITTIDLSDIPEEIVDVVVSVVFRTIFSFAVWSGEEGAVPTVLVCEEAHRYLWEDRSGRSISLAVHAAGQVAKEGRKYGVGLGVISQRPSEVSPSIVSQCGTIITLRLGNERDLTFVRNALPDSAAGLMQALPALNTREAIVFGQGVAFPTRLTVDELPVSARPRQKVRSFMEAWSKDTTDAGLVTRTIERWRSRLHQIRKA